MTNSRNRKKLKKPSDSDINKVDNEEDYKSPIAKNRILYINLRFVKFGVSDRLQGAAIFLTILLLIPIFVALIGGFFDKA